MPRRKGRKKAPYVFKGRRTLKSYASEPRSPGTPFDPSSPKGRKHYHAVSSTGSTYPCAVLPKEPIGVPPNEASDLTRVKEAISRLEVCLNGDRKRGRRVARTGYDVESNVAFWKYTWVPLMKQARAVADRLRNPFLLMALDDIEKEAQQYIDEDLAKQRK